MNIFVSGFVTGNDISQARGDRTWTVGIREEKDRLVLEDEWEDFVKENTSKLNDTLVFKYHKYGKLCLHVTLLEKTEYDHEDKVHAESLVSIDGAAGDRVAKTQLKETLDEENAPKSGESYYVGATIEHDLTYATYFRSQRRAVIEEEVSKAFESALSAVELYKPNFISVMQPSIVQRRIFMVVELQLIPSLFNNFDPHAAAANLPSSNWMHLLSAWVALF
ncbi:hypothetical protein Syun_001426 [Stephania yunnanensis]|uniref:TF-B3 domain-containing protein n=1 Tax=Stephania yunnanensis TaxID=152371 RepID=A0AAP0QAW5_9MAGN